MWMSNKALLWVLNSLIAPTAGRNANMLWDKRDQNRGDILSAFPDWVLKHSGNRLRVLKMSLCVPGTSCRMKFSGQHLWVKIRREMAEMQMLTIADEGLFPPCVFLLRTAHVCFHSVERARSKGEDTPALVQQVLAVPNTLQPFPAEGGSLLCWKLLSE